VTVPAGPAPPPEIFWFIPCAGDGRYLGAATRPNGFAYLASVAQAADSLGFDGVLLPTGGLGEDTIVIGSALLALTRHLRFLVAVRPGLISPILAAPVKDGQTSTWSAVPASSTSRACRFRTRNATR
jgi:alkanesulfonate monooxygenase